jgi:hypothetical protein
MGQDLGELSHALSNELTWLHWHWRQFHILFGDKDSRIELLNDAAPIFFRMVQDTFFEHTLLRIARLVSAPVSFNHPQLSVTRLPLLLPGPQPPPTSPRIREEVADLVERAKNAAAFAVDWRHNKIAHSNLALALGRPVKPLTGASRKDVEDSLEALRAVMNHVETVYAKSTTSYSHFSVNGDAESLLYVLRDGIRFDEQRCERRAKGEWTEEDLRRPDPI